MQSLELPTMSPRQRIDVRRNDDPRDSRLRVFRVMHVCDCALNYLHPSAHSLIEALRCRPTLIFLAPSKPPSVSFLSRINRNDPCSTALQDAMPITLPVDPAKYSVEAATAEYTGSMEAWMLMNSVDPATPMAKPPGIMYSASNQLVCPCQRRMSRVYAIQAEKMAIWVGRL